MRRARTSSRKLEIALGPSLRGDDEVRAIGVWEPLTCKEGSSNSGLA